MMKILIICILILMFVPLASANHVDGTIVDKQIIHPDTDYSIPAGWTKYPNSGTFASHLTSNDGDSSTINYTGADWIWFVGFNFDNHNIQGKISVDMWFVAKNIGDASVIFMRLWSADYNNYIHRAFSVTSGNYENYSASLYWSPTGNKNWTIDDLNTFRYAVYVGTSGIFVITEIGVTMTIVQFEPSAGISPIVMYLIGMIILLIINLIGYTKIPILCIFGIIGTMILAIPTVDAFGDYSMMAIILILINVGLPVIGLAKARNND